MRNSEGERMGHRKIGNLRGKKINKKRKIVCAQRSPNPMQNKSTLDDYKNCRYKNMMFFSCARKNVSIDIIA